MALHGKRRYGAGHRGDLALLLAATVCLSSPAMAGAEDMSPPMGHGMRHGMMMDGSGHGSAPAMMMHGDREPMMMGGDGHNKHGSKHGMEPHNAAAHFLKMADMLDLSAEQTKRLREMRDKYIEQNSVAEEQLCAARGDLMPLLFADEVDMAATEKLLSQIGRLEGGLWRAFARQLHDIKAMLTPEQREMLQMMKE